MSRMKFLCTVILLTGIAAMAPRAGAQATLKVMIAGASGAWQALGVGTYKDGACPTGSAAGCRHYTNGSFSLTDTRPTLPAFGQPAVTDGGAIWIVWDNANADPTCATSCNVWAYIKVDSIVGNRCYFARPRCVVTSPSPFPAPSNSIAAAIWGADTAPPAPVQALFTTGRSVSVASTEIRPEDALFAQCRINSAAGGGSDGVNGLGLGVNASGVCPAFGSNYAHLAGTDLVSAYPGSTSTAHPLAFNISGKDPFSGTAITPAFSTVNVGAYPLIFITNRQGALANVKDATLQQLQAAFSGADCRGSVFSGGAATAINVYSREPLSGTMNTAEYSALRLPRDSSGNYDTVNGSSQEIGLTGIEPVNGVACGAGGKRYQPIGTGEEVNFVKNSNTNFGVDGIGYAFFSYGNVSGIASNANYAYLTINGVDPLFHVYGSTYDPGEAANPGNLPGVADLPAACAGGFPCTEAQIWKGGESFPNLRNGSYRQWAMIRLVGDGAALTNAKALVTSTQASVVSKVPDFVPAAPSAPDKGLQLLRSHYTQSSVVPNNTTEKGGEEGGCILAAGDTSTKLVMRATGCVVGP